MGPPVALTATTGVGSTFTGWSGNCTGTGGCNVIMTETRDVPATFVPAVTLTATIPPATEGGRIKGVFTFTRTGGTASSLIVYYRVTGTAIPVTDYVRFGTSLTFPAGAGTVSRTVTPRADRCHERNKSVIVRLTPHPSYTGGSPRSVRVPFLNEDPFPQLR